MLDACFSAIEENERSDSAIRSSGKTALLVAISEPTSGSILNVSQLKRFNFSRATANDLITHLGFPVIQVKVKSETLMVAKKSFDTRSGAREISQYLGLSFDDLYAGEGFFSNQRKNRISREGRDDFFGPLRDKFVGSAPKQSPLGRVVFTYPSESVDSVTNTFPLVYGNPFILPVVAMTAFGDGNGKPLYRNNQSAFYLLPETMVQIQDPSGAPKVHNRRYPGSGGVAFPIVIDIPVTDTQHLLKLELKLIGDRRKF